MSRTDNRKKTMYSADEEINAKPHFLENQLRKLRKLRLIDLFSGAGGMSLGFSPKFGHDFKSVWANDYNLWAAQTYRNYFGHCIHGDIIDLLRLRKIEIPEADLVVGGPPCQGFSLLNKNKHADPRKQLWRPFLEVVARSGAELFVMENVPQLKGSPEYDQIEWEADKLGFQISAEILSACDYGVPQRRHRVFIIGCKFADPNLFFPPKRTHYNFNGNAPTLFRLNGDYVDNPRPWSSVKDAIADLPDPEGTEVRTEIPGPLDLHFGRTPTSLSMERYRTIPEEGMNRFDLQRRAPELTPECWIRKKSGGTDLFGRLWWDKPAFTIRTEFFKPEKGRYLHPVKHRPITHREAARLQTFPDDFKFFGSKIEIAKQIGNAVPPLLAARVADSIRELFHFLHKNAGGR
jgi:DNA (cytosine-5)-methyltransferase 1